MKRLRGVTLIELLVVVAVIALLLAVITPSLKTVQEKASLIKCANNQHQVVLAVSGYASEWHGRLPEPVSVVGTPNVLWRTSDVTAGESVQDAHSSLGNYLESSEVYNCPLANFAKDEKSLSGRSYQDHYTDPYNGDLSVLFCSYQLLWNYDSFNPVLTSGLRNGLASPFAGASKRSKNKIVICEAMSFTDDITENGMFSDTWASPHRFEGSSKNDESGFPFFFREGNSVDDIDNDASLRQIRLNAGYIDGRVERYVAGDTFKAQISARTTSMLIPKSWK